MPLIHSFSERQSDEWRRKLRLRGVEIAPEIRAEHWDTKTQGDDILSRSPQKLFRLEVYLKRLQPLAELEELS